MPSFLCTRNASETNNVRIKSLHNFLKHGLPADEWFKGLDVKVKKDQDRFEEVFEKLVPAGRGRLVIQRRIDQVCCCAGDISISVSHVDP